MAARRWRPGSTGRAARWSVPTERSTSATRTTTASGRWWVPADGRPRSILSAGIAAGLATAVLLLTVVPPPAAASATLDAVTTPGSGTLTMCRDWLVYKSCATYHRIPVPQHVAIGDKLELDYGSNQKHYIFHVVRIRHDGANCTILSDASGDGEDGEKIEVPECRATAKPADSTR